MRLKNLFTVPEGQKITEKTFGRILVSSVCSMLLCMACLAGTTWAWFAAEIENSGNVIEIAAVTVETEIYAQEIPAAVTGSDEQGTLMAVTGDGEQSVPAAENGSGTQGEPAAENGEGEPDELSKNGGQSEPAASTAGGITQGTPVAKNEAGAYELAAGKYRIRAAVVSNAAKPEGFSTAHPVYVLMTVVKAGGTECYCLPFPTGSGAAEKDFYVGEAVTVSFAVSWVEPDSAVVITEDAPAIGEPPAEEAPGENNDPVQEENNGLTEKTEGQPAESSKENTAEDTTDDSADGAEEGKQGETGEENTGGNGEESSDAPAPTPPDAAVQTPEQQPSEDAAEEVQDPSEGA